MIQQKSLDSLIQHLIVIFPQRNYCNLNIDSVTVEFELEIVPKLEPRKWRSAITIPLCIIVSTLDHIPRLFNTNYWLLQEVLRLRYPTAKLVFDSFQAFSRENWQKVAGGRFIRALNDPYHPQLRAHWMLCHFLIMNGPLHSAFGSSLQHNSSTPHRREKWERSVLYGSRTTA